MEQEESKKDGAPANASEGEEFKFPRSKHNDDNMVCDNSYIYIYIIDSVICC